MKQKTAKPGEPLADASTEIGSEDIEIPDISEALKAAQSAQELPRRPLRRERGMLCPICHKPECIWSDVY